ANDTEGRPYFAMKRLQGETLATVLGQIASSDLETLRKFPRERLLRAFVEVCLAVEFAHVRGVIHRDLKPSNIMLGDFGEVFVLDWGVAKLVGDPDARAPLRAALSGELAAADEPRGVTRTGVVIGTRAYMAPEQHDPKIEIDNRADVFTLGCILVEIVI